MYRKCNCKSNLQIASVKENVDEEINNELEYNSQLNIPTSCVINGHLYETNLVILEADELFKISRKQWLEAENVVFRYNRWSPKVNLANSRKQIVDILSCCRYSIHSCIEDKKPIYDLLLKHVKLLNNTITPWSKLDERSLEKLTSSDVIDDRTLMYQYFHMYLDIKWLILSITNACEPALENYKELVKDLIVFSSVHFKKLNTDNVINMSPFICSCLKRLWLLLQLLNNKLAGTNQCKMRFWEIYNDLMKNQFEDFSIWFLRSIALLQGFDDNGKFIGLKCLRIEENVMFLNQNLKSFITLCAVSNKHNNIRLLNYCRLTNELLNEWWTEEVTIEPYHLLWEIFNKHINVSFDRIKIDSAMDLVQKVDQILTSSNTDNSYEYFLHLLNKYLLTHPHQWLRMRGRIYCKIPKHRINDFNNDALYNISLLFLTLSRSINISELSGELLSILSNLNGERLNNPFIINIYMSLIILHVRQGYQIKDISVQLAELAGKCSTNRRMFYLIRLYVDGLQAVLNASLNLNLQQDVLLGDWVCEYLVHCQYKDLCHFLNVLVQCVERVKECGVWVEWENTLKKQVLPGLKTVAMKENAPFQAGTLGALISPNPASDWVLTFTADRVAPKVVCQFICTLLEDAAENVVMPEHNETAILHAWTRCCLLNIENKVILTRNVMKLKAVSNLNIQDDFTEKLPLVVFVNSLAKLNPKVYNLHKLCEQCFGRLESWIVNPYLKSPQSEGITVHIYTCIAMLFLKCSHLLYQMNRSNCLLNRLTSIFLLPTDVLMGKIPHPYVVGAVQRTWHCFVRGIFALDCSGDLFLQRILRDMVACYVPLLSESNSPILKCMSDQKLAVVILEKLCGSFLSSTPRNTDGNTAKALKIITLAIETCESTENIRLILKSTLIPIMEVIVMHVHKNAALEFMKFISSNGNYSLISDCINSALISVTEKYLAFYSNNYFQFVNLLSKIIPSNLRAILPNIKTQIAAVEFKRGVGFDFSLRQGLDKLVQLLS